VVEDDPPLRDLFCNTWVRALNAVCRWLHEQGEIPTLVKLAPQRLEKRIVRTHDEAALRAILGYRPRTFSHWRVYALVSSILDTGCRIEEVLTARACDFDLDNLLLTAPQLLLPPEESRATALRVPPAAPHLCYAVPEERRRRGAALDHPRPLGDQHHHEVSAPADGVSPAVPSRFVDSEQAAVMFQVFRLFCLPASRRLEHSFITGLVMTSPHSEALTVVITVRPFIDRHLPLNSEQTELPIVSLSRSWPSCGCSWQIAKRVQH
jgi:hypothetical protein